MPKENLVIKVSDMSPDQVGVMRQMCSQVVTTLEALSSDAQMAGPLLKMFQGLKDEYNSILVKLPPTDQVPAANEAHWNLQHFFSCLTSTNALLSYLTTRMSEMQKNSYNSETLAAKITAELDAKVKAGEFFPKSTVDSLCSAAKDLGIKEANEKAQADATAAAAKATLLASRKQLLTTNSLPLPENEEALLGTDEEFTAAQARVKQQTEVLVGFGVALNSEPIRKAWAGEAEFKNYADLLKGVVVKKTKADEPFAGGNTPPGETTKPRLIV